MELYEKIQYLRKQNNMTQQDLANELSISRQAVQKWETGLTSPDLYKMPEIAKLFNTTVDKLLDHNVNFDDLINKNHENNKDSIKRNIRNYSMLDYLLILPLLVAVFIGLVMFYIIGSIIVGILIIMPLVEIGSGVFIIIKLIIYANFGASYIIIGSIITLTLFVLVYPTLLLAKYIYPIYFKQVKKMNRRIANFNFKNVFN